MAINTASPIHELLTFLEDGIYRITGTLFLKTRGFQTSTFFYSRNPLGFFLKPDLLKKWAKIPDFSGKIPDGLQHCIYPRVSTVISCFIWGTNVADLWHLSCRRGRPELGSLPCQSHTRPHRNISSTPRAPRTFQPDGRHPSLYATSYSETIRNVSPVQIVIIRSWNRKAYI